MNRRTSRGIWRGLGLLGLSLGAAVALESAASADNPSRYPYDPACPWGRLSDGHGMLLRCLEPSEATALLSRDSKISQEPAQDDAPTVDPSKQVIVVSKVHEAKANAGELPLAAKKLRSATDRFVTCTKKNGGLTQPKAHVIVSFLVRERGRAEGVGVKETSGMTTEAAKCIADVVDRRYVGYPSQPIVGATIKIELSRAE